MGAWIEKLLENLVTRVWLMLAGRVAAQVELELAATQAQLLAQAATLRRDHPEHGETIACRLEAVSERILAGDVGVGPDHGAVALPAPKALRIKSAESQNAGRAARRPRGRPKKDPQASDAVSMRPNEDRADGHVEAAL